MTSDTPEIPESQGLHTCENCYAEFEWTPFVLDGEEFCCSGCSEGGPCICTYTGAPHLTEQQAPDADAVAENSEEVEPEDEVPAASAEGGAPPEPPDQPPAPGQHADDEEPPTNGRLAIIMSAISEMPLPVQEVVRARLSNTGTEEEIGRQLGLDAEEVRQLIEQGQAILDRSIGSTFRIRYIGADQMAADDTPEPEFPDFDDSDDEQPAASTGQAGQTPSQADLSTELRDLIARSFRTITDASTGEAAQGQDSRNVLAETLREVGNLLKLTADRLVADRPSDLSLRDQLADRRGSDEPITLIIENQPDITPFFIAIQGHESVLWAKLRSHAPRRSEFNLMITSMMAFVRDMMTMEGSLRPTRLQMAGDEITVELPASQTTSEMGEEPSTPLPAAVSTNGAAPGPRFEMAVDSFFGARHFVESGTSAPHHHSYRVEATFTTTKPDQNGFVVGFASVREMVDSTVMDYSETLLNTQDPFRDIPPTTENLARVFHEQISAKLGELNVPTVRLARVRVWESPTNSASYSNSGSEPHAATAS